MKAWTTGYRRSDLPRCSCRGPFECPVFIICAACYFLFLTSNAPVCYQVNVCPISLQMCLRLKSVWPWAGRPFQGGQLLLQEYHLRCDNLNATSLMLRTTVSWFIIWHERFFLGLFDLGMSNQAYCQVFIEKKCELDQPAQEISVVKRDSKSRVPGMVKCP